MTITTKFNNGDKVWFVVFGNQYTWGKVESIDAKICLGNSSVEVLNHLKNRHYVEDLWRMSLHSDIFIYRPIISIKDEECFSTREEVIDFIKSQYQEKIDTISEYKKVRTWF